MGIYIQNMKIPAAGHILIILPSGRTLEVTADSTQNILREAKAIPIPPHGRLKDYDRIMKEYNEWFSKTESREYENMFYALQMAINGSPTIIPAEVKT